MLDLFAKVFLITIFIMFQMMDHNSDTVRVVLHTRHVIDDPSRVGLVAIGSTKPLGCWQEEDAVEADYIGFSTWQLVIRLPKYQTTYWKWAIMDRHSRQVVCRLPKYAKCTYTTLSTERRCEKTGLRGFLTWSDTNKALQSVVAAGFGHHELRMCSQ